MVLKNLFLTPYTMKWIIHGSKFVVAWLAVKGAKKESLVQA